MIPCLIAAVYQEASFPRVSGDDPTYIVEPVLGTTFSPRERG